jgi:hypothetical protein
MQQADSKGKQSRYRANGRDVESSACKFDNVNREADITQKNRREIDI